MVALISAIICVLIDGLGYINEKFGIQNGNNVLKQIVNLLFSFDKNFNVFRISNRQFAIVIPEKKDQTQICDERWAVPDRSSSDGIRRV